jgi:hypothetical protein
MAIVAGVLHPISDPNNFTASRSLHSPQPTHRAVCCGWCTLISYMYLLAKKTITTLAKASYIFWYWFTKRRNSNPLPPRWPAPIFPLLHPDSPDYILRLQVLKRLLLVLVSLTPTLILAICHWAKCWVPLREADVDGDYNAIVVTETGLPPILPMDELCSGY